MCSSSNANQAMAPQLLEVVGETNQPAPTYFSSLISHPVVSDSEEKTTGMMMRFVPEVFYVLAEV
jgi:hypothetical protein